MSILTSIQAARQHPGTRGSRQRATLSPPVYGLNTLDPLVGMEPFYAVELVNWFPDDGAVKTRRGSQLWTDIPGEDGEIGYLHQWSSGSNEKLFAFSPSGVHDVSVKGSSRQVVASGVTSSRWSGVNSNGNSIFVNGTDTPLRVDESGRFVDHGFTVESGSGDLDLSDLRTVHVHRGRLWFTEADSARVWYSGVDAVTGELTVFDAGGVTREGGNVLAIGSLTVDTGSGADDLLVLCMQRGQVLVYTGDPDDSFNLSGTYQQAPVVGRRPLLQFRNDLIAITTDGYRPLAASIAAGREARNVSISDKINPTVKDALSVHGSDEGWSAVYHGDASWLLFNVGGAGVQHVMNTSSRAWTTFSGMDAECWAGYGDRLMFGSKAGKVIEANTGATDSGRQIQYRAVTAYNYLETPERKRVRRVQPHFESLSGSATLRFGVASDFSLVDVDLREIRLESAGSPWDSRPWDEFQWAGGLVFRDEIDGYAAGDALAIVVEMSSSGAVVVWYATGIKFIVLRR